MMNMYNNCRESFASIVKQKLWRKHNSHNMTTYEGPWMPDKVTVGNHTYGPIKVYANKKNDARLCIGNYCSIAENVSFLLSMEHPTENISTFPFTTQIMCSGELEASSKGNIVLDDDVWVGFGSTILSGVHIGQGAIVAAGAVVSKDVPPYAIVGGVPAKIIKYRFSPELIEELLKVDYTCLTKELILSHIEEFYDKLEDKSQLNWMPKK